VGRDQIDIDQTGEVLGLNVGERPAVALADIVDQDALLSPSARMCRQPSITPVLLGTDVLHPIHPPCHR
jgi:hypothetical protein